jgi:CheY-like chemotaxis protein
MTTASSTLPAHCWNGRAWPWWGAGSCAEAVDRATALQPDVMLIDIRLSDESGFEAARRLATEGQAAALIMISTDREADCADLIADSPAIGFLAKTDLSAAAIQRLLGNLPATR